MLEVRDFPEPPLDIQKSEAKAAERLDKFIKSRLKRLSADQVESIEKKLDKWYKAWHDQTRPQRDKLKRWGDLLEGVVQDSNFPFEGASNITLHYAAGMVRTFRASFNKTAYQDEELFFPIFSPVAPLPPAPTQQGPDGQQTAAPQAQDPGAPPPPELVQVLEAGFNHSFSRLCNGIATLKEGTVPVVRDGTLVVSGRWRRETQRCFDQRTYRSYGDFVKDYPDAKTAGMTEEDYADARDFFLAGDDADDPPEMVANFYYDFVKFDKPEYRVGPWAKFVRYPTFARELDSCQFHGYETSESRDALKLLKKRGIIYDAGLEKVLKHNNESKIDGWDKQLGFVEGIIPDQDTKRRAIKYVDGVCMMDMDGDGVPEKYEIWYAPEEKALLRMTPYRLRKNIDCHVVFRLVRRENRLDGVSLIGDCEDLFNQIDVLVRHRNNVRIMTTSPVFIAKASLKDELDLGKAENVFRPGLTFWVDDLDRSIKQLQIQDLSSTGDSMDEQMMYGRHIELVFGPTQGQAGQSYNDDKRASGKKTIALLNQANSRIDDYMDEFFLSAPKLAELHAALLFQYSAEPEFRAIKDGKAISFPVALLAHPNLSWGIKRRSIQLTPEFAMQRLGGLQALYTNLRELLANGDPIAMELWNRQVIASGEPQAAELLLSGANMQKVAMAFQQMQAQGPNNPDKAAMKAGKQAYAKRAAIHAADHFVGKDIHKSGQNGKTPV